MFKKFAAIALTAIATGTAGVMAPTPAEAGNTCKQVYMKVVNQTGGKIKIIDVDYWNPATGKYKSEPTRNEVIRHGQIWTNVRNLEQVNARNTWIRIKYRESKSGITKWTKVRKASSSSSVCGHGSTYQLVLR